MTIFGASTKLYRVALLLAQALALGAVMFDQFGPGLGLTPTLIAEIDSIVSAIIVALRQITDETTPTFPK